MLRRRPASLDADLRRWREQFAEATPIAELRPRRNATVVGVVMRIRVVPGRSLTLRLSDGTGELESVWSARNALAGITLGSGLRLSATVARDQDGQWRMRNPAWTPVAEPFSFPP